MDAMKDTRAAIHNFAEEIRRNFSVASLAPAHIEDQLKSPVRKLLEDIGQHLGYRVITRTEAHVENIDGRPDIAVVVNNALVGHVELKAPGKGARPSKYRGADAKQWERFRDLPNLIYTDGQEWALYRNGELVGHVVDLGDIVHHKLKALDRRIVDDLELLFRQFFAWRPIVPSSPKALAELLAPLCRLLRDEVLMALRVPNSPLVGLIEDWRKSLFPDAKDKDFANAYAQTVTYAMLLARLAGETDLNPDKVVLAIQAQHGLLAEVLRVLAHPLARQQLEMPIELLQRQIAAVNPDLLKKRADRDLWLYFYEDFLAAYDDKLRKAAGVYYTPPQVVSAQIALVSELLEKKFGKQLTFVDDGVIFLDPAAGTGTYILAALQDGLERVRKLYGEGAVPEWATKAAKNMHAFEVLIGPYAVCHLRVTQTLLAAGARLPGDGVHVYLTDTLESPYSEPPGQQELGFFYKTLAEENRRARQVKASAPVMVCIGNPPYRREDAAPRGEEAKERRRNWVRYGDENQEGILKDFLEPLYKMDAGLHAKNLYNLYVYFWRWALWKVFEMNDGPGIVSFITASSYLRGPGFAGMREVMRRTFDEMWIIDLGGDAVGARKSENVFFIKTPVAIAVGVRYGKPNPKTPAKVWYTEIEGTKEEKLLRLAMIRGFDDLPWEEVFSEWAKPFVPKRAGGFASWPLLTDLFPWQATGVLTGRTWIISPDADALRQRWKLLTDAPVEEKPALFRISKGLTFDPNAPWVAQGAPTPPIVRYGYRSFDRQWILMERRMMDRPNPSLLSTHSERQVYLTSLLTGSLGPGPAAVITESIPDKHHFRGSYGGKDVIPLWRDADATVPNMDPRLLQSLSDYWGTEVSPQDVMAYCYAILANPSYFDRFEEKLASTPPRIPLTKDRSLWERAVKLGKRLIYLHTFGRRAWQNEDSNLLVGRARCLVPIPDAPAGYRYESKAQRLLIGDGVIAPVPPEVFGFQVSEFSVVRSWLDYRLGKGVNAKSPLDNIGFKWSFTSDLLQLLWVLERTLQLYPALDKLLDDILASDLWEARDLPTPPDSLRKKPKTDGGQLRI